MPPLRPVTPATPLAPLSLTQDNLARITEDDEEAQIAAEQQQPLDNDVSSRHSVAARSVARSASSSALPGVRPLTGARSVARSTSSSALLQPGPQTLVAKPGMQLQRNSNSLIKVPSERGSYARSEKSSVQAMKRRTREKLEARREEIQRGLEEVEADLARASTTVSAASSIWYVMHKAKKLALAPSSQKFTWTAEDGPKLPEPGILFPKPGDWIKKEGFDE